MTKSHPNSSLIIQAYVLHFFKHRNVGCDLRLGNIGALIITCTMLGFLVMILLIIFPKALF